jgi:hypothetical protein
MIPASAAAKPPMRQAVRPPVVRRSKGLPVSAISPELLVTVRANGMRSAVVW